MSRVLIVDEQGDCHLGIAGPLRCQGFEVVSIHSYLVGLQELQKTGQRFDLVVLNIAGSPRKGLEWLQQTRAVRFRLGLFPDGVFCVASPFLDPQVELDIEHEGGRVVYEQQIRSSAA